MNHACFRRILTLCVSLILGMQINLYSNITEADIQQAQLIAQKAQEAQEILQNYESNGKNLSYQISVLQGLHEVFTTIHTMQEKSVTLSNDWSIINIIQQLENNGIHYVRTENNIIPLSNGLNNLIKYLAQTYKQKRSMPLTHPGKTITPTTRPSIKRTPTSVSIEKERKIVGELGQEYVQKFDEIYKYNYTKSMHAGFPNLATSLEREIKNVNKDAYHDYPKFYIRHEMASNSYEEKTFFIKPDPATMEDLKDTIDRLYRALQKYRIRDNQ